jgi:hypothetical protein
MDIFVIRTKTNTFTYHIFKDKIFETNISYNYHINRYLNDRDKWDYVNFKKDNFTKNNKKFLIKFN